MPIDPATVQWDAEPAKGALKEADVQWDDDKGLDIDIVGGRRESEVQAHPANQSDFARLISGQPAQPQGGNAATRFLGEIGGRQVLQGAYGLYGALGGDALNEYVLSPIDRAIGWGNQLGIGDRTYRQAAAEQADEWGMRRPQTASERIISDIGEGLTGTALTFGVGGALANLGGQTGAVAPSIANRVGTFLKAQPGLQTASTVTGSGASSATREAGGGEGAQLVAGLAGGLAPGAAGAATGATLRGLARGRSGANMEQAIQDFASLGAAPSVGQASGNRLIQGAENLFAGGPTSAGVMGNFAERQARNIGEGLQDAANNLSRNASAERAGRAIERGVELFGKNTRATKAALYWDADRQIPESTQVPLANTWQSVVKLTTPMRGAEATTGALVNPRISQLRDALAQDISAGGGQIPYAALKRIRTDIGETISDYSLSPDTPTRELNQLYGALSRDMEAAAKSVGPEAARAAKRANNYTRVVASRLEQVQRIIDKNGGPEKVYEAALSGTRDGGTTLRAVMQSLPPESQKAVSGAVLKRMGMATPGNQDAAGDVFSAATFLTNWNRVSPEAKRALFDRFGKGFSRDMDRIARVSQNIKEGAKVFQNPSGTANRAAAMSYGIGLGGSIAQAPVTGQLWPIAATVGGGIAANIAARAMTSPLAVNWLARSTAMPRGSIVSSLQNLSRTAEREGDEAAYEFAQALLEQQPEGAPDERSEGNQN